MKIRKTEDEITRTINIHGSKPVKENQNLINKTFSEIKEAGANVLESANKYANQTSKQGSRSKQQIKDAKAYEERRRREIAQARFEYEQEQEEQRRQREEHRRDR